MSYIKLFEEYSAKGFEYEIHSPGTYKINYNIKDVPIKKGVYIKIFDFELEIEHDGAGWFEKTIKDSVALVFTDDSTGMFDIGKDVAKYSGLSLKDAQAYNETPDDAYGFGLVNMYNGGKDIFFWTNGTRLVGAAKNTTPMLAIIEQLVHESGVHLTTMILQRQVAKNLDIKIDNGDWVTADYGYGEYHWPAIGEGEDMPDIVSIDGETLATSAGAITQMLTKEFFVMASRYLPEIKPVLSFL